MYRIFWIALAALALVALPAVAADIHIQSGIDVWWTSADGSTRADFQQEPIPAGFFCTGSKAFTGSIYFSGVPVATFPEGILEGADTVVHRLDDVVVGDSGKAVTRVQVAALNLRSVTPVETRCGRFHVTASLYGEQPITRMEIFRESHLGGSYAAPLSLNVRLTFTAPDSLDSRPRELVQSIDLDPAPNSRWVSNVEGQNRYATGYVTVDGDGDDQPETLLPGTSPTFLPGPPEAGQTRRPDDLVLYCHENSEGHQHCIYCLPGGHFCAV